MASESEVLAAARVVEKAQAALATAKARQEQTHRDYLDAQAAMTQAENAAHKTQREFLSVVAGGIDAPAPAASAPPPVGEALPSGSPAPHTGPAARPGGGGEPRPAKGKTR